MAVRSARLAYGASGAAGATKVIYTCPAGVTALVKDIRCAKLVSGVSGLYLGARSGPEPVWLLHGDVPADQNVRALEPWIVLEPGHELVIFSPTAAAWSYWISGSELEGVAP